MTDLKIESVDHLQRGSVNIYAANCGEDRRIIAESLYAFEKYDAVETMVAELHDRPEFCQIAAAVHGLHLAESDATPTTEAIAILTKLCDSRQPEAIRTRADNLLIDIAEDDRAVCDASEVDERPGQDAGAKLVGVECYIFDPATGDSSKDAMHGPSSAGGRRGVVTSVKVYGDDLWYALDRTGFFRHARPAYLGLPEVTP